MHELSLCQAILDQVDQRAGDREVRRAEVRIGYLRQVVPDSLTFAWEMLTDGSHREGCELVVEHIPARVRCRSCAVETTLDWPVLACAACEGIDVDLLSGNELELAWLDVSTTVP